jgi:hypothetical protein
MISTSGSGAPFVEDIAAGQMFFSLFALFYWRSGQVSSKILDAF